MFNNEKSQIMFDIKYLSILSFISGFLSLFLFVLYCINCNFSWEILAFIPLFFLFFSSFYLLKSKKKELIEHKAKTPCNGMEF